MSYLEFRENDPIAGRKTKTFSIYNKSGEFLGSVSFSGAWRKYIFNGTNSIFDAGCLQDIVDFLKDQTQQWRDSL
jgi:hypothetical protein